MTDPLKRRSIRIPDFNYADGTFFFTICTWQRRCVFGEIVNYQMHANQIGASVTDTWLKIIHDNEGVELDEWVLMPNHLHAIVSLSGGKTLGQLIGKFKTMSTRAIRNNGLMVPWDRLWQRNYYEHWIRSERRLVLIRQYIRTNPEQWAVDVDNPEFSCDLRDKKIIGQDWIAPIEAGVP